MTLEVRLDEKQIRESIGMLNSLSRQVPFAMMVAVNRTAEEATAAFRPHLMKTFTIRQKGLLNMVAPQTLPSHMRATKERPAVLLKTRDYSRVLERFETGEDKVPGRGVDGRARPVITPTSELRPTKQTIIPRAMYPINLGLEARRTINPRREGPYYYALGRGSLGGISKGKVKARKTPFHATKTGKLQIKGRRGTFVLNELTAPYMNPEKWGVYRRQGSEVRKLWNIVPRVEIDPILKFSEVQSPVASRRLRPNFEGAFAFATRTAR